MADSLPNLRASKLFDVSGKTVLVTGGGSGLGAMMASAFAQNGAQVIIASRREKQLKALADVLTQNGPGSCEYVVGDLGSKAGCDAVAAEVRKRVQKLNVLINNAGATWGAPYGNVPEDKGWDKIFNLNVKSIFYLTVALTDLLAKDATNIDPGRIINVASVAGLSSQAEETGLSAEGMGLWSYNSSKAAAIHLTRLQSTTLSSKNIVANVICPGVFPSKMTAWAVSKQVDALNRSQPMGRIGTPEDMAGLALFLASRASAHISGDVIPIDGGALNHGGRYVQTEGKAKL